MNSNWNYLFEDYIMIKDSLHESTFNDYVNKWIDGDDLNSIRNFHSAPFYKKIYNGNKYDVLYRYIDSSINKPNSHNYDLYHNDIGSTVVLDLVSTTTSNPKEAWDDWFTPGTDVIKVIGARGFDVNSFGSHRFDWEKEIIVCGEFKIIDRKFVKDKRRTDYNLITIEYIDNIPEQKRVLANLLKTKLIDNRKNRYK